MSVRVGCGVTPAWPTRGPRTFSAETIREWRVHCEVQQAGCLASCRVSSHIRKCSRAWLDRVLILIEAPRRMSITGDRYRDALSEKQTTFLGLGIEAFPSSTGIALHTRYGLLLRLLAYMYVQRYMRTMAQ